MLSIVLFWWSLKVCDKVNVVPEVEREDSVMESWIIDNEATDTDSDINSHEGDNDDGDYCVLSSYNKEEVEPD